MVSQRDAFFTSLLEEAKKNKDIILISADMGAPSLDRWRTELSGQYINAGIAEANAIGVATGLAKIGKKVFVYSIAPFVTLRCYEQIKMGPVLHKLPITIVGIGAGFSYGDAGPSHHAVEDISIMRTLPGVDIINIRDSEMARTIIPYCLQSKTIKYIRLDRDTRGRIDLLTDGNLGYCFCNPISPREGNKIIFTYGSLLHDLNTPTILVNFWLIEVWKLPFRKSLGDYIKNSHLFTVEEHFLNGGFGSAILEFCIDNKVPFLSFTRIGIDNNEYCYISGRENLKKHYRLDLDSIYKKVSEHGLCNNQTKQQKSLW